MAHWTIENWNNAGIPKKAAIIALISGGIGLPVFNYWHNSTRVKPLLENTSTEQSAEEEQKLAPVYDDKTGQYIVEFSPNEKQAIPLEDKITFENKTTVSMFNELVASLQRDYKQELNGRKFSQYEILQIA